MFELPGIGKGGIGDRGRRGATRRGGGVPRARAGPSAACPELAEGPSPHSHILYAAFCILPPALSLSKGRLSTLTFCMLHSAFCRPPSLSGGFACEARVGRWLSCARVCARTRKAPGGAGTRTVLSPETGSLETASGLNGKTGGALARGRLVGSHDKSGRRWDDSRF